jgi:hypothetical protein
MAFTKFASYEVSEVLDIKGASSRQRTASLDKLADYADYRTGDGYIYARIIAQSSRVNKNHDGWPSIELAGGQEAWDEITSKHEAGAGPIVAHASSNHKKGFSTFIGKPIFVDHNNSDPKRARGVIVDSKLHIKDAKTAAEGDEYWGSGDADEEHMPPTEIELLLEIDAESFPKFAEAVIDGSKDGSKGIDGFSMGCDVEYSKCSHCGHKASAPEDYCSHIKMKGAELKVEAGRHSGTHKKSYENCYGIGYFEISGVFDPADETALTQELIDEQPSKHAGSYLARRTAEAPMPQVDHTTAPENVDTLREEKICPVCGSDMESEKCDVCGYEEPPEQLQNPDLTKHQEQPEQSDGLVPDEQSDQLVEDSQVAKQPGSYLQNRKTPDSPAVTNAMPQNLTHTASGGGDEPSDETVTSDQTKPVTSAFRTAQELIQATKRNQENRMANQRHAGEPADPSGKPDKRVDVEGVGGVMDDSLDAAARADRRVDVEGKGGVYQDSNAEASKPDAKESLPTAGKDSDDSGFNKDKTTGDSGKTRTWDNSNEPGSAVTQKPFPNTERGAARQAGDDRPWPHGDDALAQGGSAKQGVKPNGGKDVQPQRRENVLEHSTSPNNNSGPTDTWSGTGGNGVTRQQEPVTKKVDPNIEQPRRSFSLAALRLAETEIEVGILDPEKKFDRLVELENVADDVVEAQQSTLAKVRTASIRKNAATEPKGLGRVPQFSRIASAVDAETQQKTAAVDDDMLDSAMFSR